nr:MAG TPA: Integrin alpha-X, DPC MICELLES, CELL ADHESION [Caudoviricetes sp.]
MLLLMAKDAPRYVSVEEQKKRQYKEMMKKIQKESAVGQDPVAFFQTHISAD